MPKCRFARTFLAAILFLQSAICRGESIDDKLPQISPDYSPGAGEFIHGSGYGKLLMRVMMFGATQQGIHYFPEGTDLLFAILYTGGYGDNTKLNGLSIRRRGVRHLIEVDLEDLIEVGKPIPKLVDGDIVNVPFSWRKYYGEMMFYVSVFSTLSALLLSVVALVK